MVALENDFRTQQQFKQVIRANKVEPMRSITVRFTDQWSAKAFFSLTSTLSLCLAWENYKLHARLQVWLLSWQRRMGRILSIIIISSAGTENYHFLLLPHLLLRLLAAATNSFLRNFSSTKHEWGGPRGNDEKWADSSVSLPAVLVAVRRG